MSEAPRRPHREDREAESPRRPGRVIALAVLISGVVVLAVAPALGGYLTMVAAGAGLVLIVIGASLGPRQPR